MAVELVNPSLPLQVDAAGVIRVGGTRIPLDTLVSAFNLGSTAEEIAQQYPTLDLADVYAAISYYLNRREEVEQYLRHRQQLAQETMRLNETRSGQAGVRERLLARKVQ